MNNDAEQRADEMIHKLRKLKGFCPMTPQEADAAFDASPAVPMSAEEISNIVAFVTSAADLVRRPASPVVRTADTLTKVDPDTKASDSTAADVSQASGEPTFQVGDLVSPRANPAVLLPIIEVIRGGVEARYRVFENNAKVTYYESQLQLAAAPRDAVDDDEAGRRQPL